MKKFSIGMVILMALAAGCGFIADMYPSTVPDVLVDYLDKDPCTVGYPAVGKVERMRKAAVVKHLTTQLDLKAEMEKDQVVYEQSISQSNSYIAKARQEYNELIGTVANPGWLLAAVFGITGVGSYLTGLRTQRPQDYNTDEHVAELAAAKAAGRQEALAEIAISSAMRATVQGVGALLQPQVTPTV